MSDHSTEDSRVLDAHPGLRERVKKLPKFVSWRNTLPSVEIDDELFYVVGADQLQDSDQVIVAWIHMFRPELLLDEGGAE